jgi:NADH:ubiquinone reductase (H+-translocating)
MIAQRARVVIVGGGFAGVAAARALKQSEVEVLLMDRRNHHIFQPLLYQVATAMLAPADVAAPLRQLSQQQSNLSLLLGEVLNVDLESNSVEVEPAGLPRGTETFEYQIIATGVQPDYFGHSEFAQHSLSLKTLTDAELIRTRVLGAYELAENTEDAESRQRALTFVLVGAGPTGVELAASIVHMSRITLRSNFRHFNPAATRILLLEGANRVLPIFDESLSRKVQRHLERLGAEVRTGALVQLVDNTGVVVGGERMSSNTVLWTAGVKASPVVQKLGAAGDRAGRVRVGEYLNLDKYPRVFVVGDAASVVQHGRALPGVAQVAIQQGRFAGELIAAQVLGRSLSQPFRYQDRGNMAVVVGKNFAILERGKLRLAGFATWIVWALLHIMFLPQLQNRLRVQTQWIWSYLTSQRSSRIISEPKRDY